MYQALLDLEDIAVNTGRAMELPVQPRGSILSLWPNLEASILPCYQNPLGPSQHLHAHAIPK